MIDFLQLNKPGAYDLKGFRQGLKDAGLVEGQNLTIEYRFANDEPGHLAGLAADLVKDAMAAAPTLGVGPDPFPARPEG